MSNDIYDTPTKKQLLERIRNTWDTYGEIENSDMTTNQLHAADELLRDFEALYDE